MSKPEFLTSTGHLGVVEERQDERLYFNSPFSAGPGQTETEFQGLVGQGQALGTERVSRVVMRGLVSNQALEEIWTGKLRPYLEVALPLQEFDKPGWLVYLAKNEPERGMGANVNEIRH